MSLSSEAPELGDSGLRELQDKHEAKHVVKHAVNFPQTSRDPYPMDQRSVPKGMDQRGCDGVGKAPLLRPSTIWGLLERWLGFDVSPGRQWMELMVPFASLSFGTTSRRRKSALMPRSTQRLLRRREHPDCTCPCLQSFSGCALLDSLTMGLAGLAVSGSHRPVNGVELGTKIGNKLAEVSHVIWSTAEDTRSMVPPHDSRIPRLQKSSVAEASGSLAGKLRLNTSCYIGERSSNSCFVHFLQTVCFRHLRQLG